MSASRGVPAVRVGIGGPSSSLWGWFWLDVGHAEGGVGRRDISGWDIQQTQIILSNTRHAQDSTHCEAHK